MEKVNVYLGFLIAQENLPDKSSREKLIEDNLLWILPNHVLFGIKLDSIKSNECVAVPDDLFFGATALASEESRIYNLALKKFPDITHEKWPKIYIANEEWL